MKKPRNSAILRRAALGPAPVGYTTDPPYSPREQNASSWVEGAALVAVLQLFPIAKSVGHRAFGGMTEQEARLALLFVAAAEQAEGR